jgi:RNA polymerase sigma-70 factor (ECF subfamily)
MAHPIVEQIPRLRRYARALTGRRDEADDLVQDTLERAWAKWSLWRRGSNVRPWLFAIMHNVFVNQLSRARLRLAPLEAAAEAPAPPVQEAAARARDLEAALAALPAAQREVLLLVGLEELTYAEAARVLAVPVGTVTSRLAAARARLRALAGDTPDGAREASR